MHEVLHGYIRKSFLQRDFKSLSENHLTGLFSLSCACTKEENPNAFQIESYFCHEHSTNYKKEKVIKVLTDKIYQKLDIHVRFSGPVFKGVTKLIEGEEMSENPLSI